jgi:hypothetical protein
MHQRFGRSCRRVPAPMPQGEDTADQLGFTGRAETDVQLNGTAIRRASAGEGGSPVTVVSLPPRGRPPAGPALRKSGGSCDEPGAIGGLTVRCFRNDCRPDSRSPDGRCPVRTVSGKRVQVDVGQARACGLLPRPSGRQPDGRCQCGHVVARAVATVDMATHAVRSRTRCSRPLLPQVTATSK